VKSQLYAAAVAKSVDRKRVKRGTAQQHLLTSAQQLFEERGYRGTTTKDISEHAGVSETLIFRYFGSKAELFMSAVVNPMLEILSDASESWRTDELYRATPEKYVIHEFVCKVMNLISDYHGSVKTILSLLTEPPPDFDVGIIRSRVVALLGELSPANREYFTQKHLTKSDSDLVLRIAIISVVSNAMLISASYEDRMQPSTSTIASQLTRFVIGGLLPSTDELASQLKSANGNLR
jgi:AcrR family transcriptional regulator